MISELLLSLRFIVPIATLLFAGDALASNPNAGESRPPSTSDLFILHYEKAPEKVEKNRFTPVCISRADAQDALKRAGFGHSAVTRPIPEERLRTIPRLHIIHDMIENGQYQNIITTRACSERIGDNYYDRTGVEERKLKATFLLSERGTSEQSHVPEARNADALAAPSTESSEDGQDFVVIHYDEQPEICWDGDPPEQCQRIVYSPVCLGRDDAIAVLEESALDPENIHVTSEARVSFSEMRIFLSSKKHVLTTRECARDLLELYHQETAGEGAVYMKEILKFSEGLPIGRWKNEPWKKEDR